MKNRFKKDFSFLFDKNSFHKGFFVTSQFDRKIAPHEIFRQTELKAISDFCQGNLKTVLEQTRQKSSKI